MDHFTDKYTKEKGGGGFTLHYFIFKTILEEK